MLLEDLVHPKMDPLDDVPAVVEDPADVLRVDGAGEMGVAVVGGVLLGVPLRGLLGDLKEIVPDEVLGPSKLPICPAVDLGHGFGRHGIVHKFGEVVLEVGPSRLDFILQQVLLVEEQDHRYGSQPSVVPDRSEEVKGLTQSVLRVVFSQDHVVGGGSRHKDDGGDIVEALNPLAPLISLASNVEHVELDLVHAELGLKDTRGQHTGS